MFLSQKVSGGVWYLVDSQKEVNRDSGKVRYKKIWRSTHTEDRGAAESIMQEILSARMLAKREQNKDKIRKLILERAEATSEILLIRKTPLEEVWRLYLAHPKTALLSRSTFRNSEITWRKFSEFMKESGIGCIEAVTREKAMEFLQNLPGTDTTKRLRRTILLSIFNRTKDDIGMDKTPLDGTSIEANDGKSRRCFTQEELRLIFQNLTGEWKPVCTVALYTGLRFGDCCTLRRSEYTGDHIIREPQKLKRHKQRLIIPVHPVLRQALDKWISLTSPDEFLFPKLASQYQRKWGGKSREFSALLQRLHITGENSDELVGFHSFRHTFNTMLADTGADTSTRMKLTGHSSVDMNLVYTHATAALQKAIDALPTIGIA